MEAGCGCWGCLVVVVVVMTKGVNQSERVALEPGSLVSVVRVAAQVTADQMMMVADELNCTVIVW